jgi:hypothetical protein
MLEFKELQEVDLKLFLQSGSPIKVGNLVIEPYILEEIKDYGYTNYMRNLQWLSITVDDFISSIDDTSKRSILEEQKANLKTLDFYIKFGGQEILGNLLKALAMIFKTDDVRLLDNDTGIISINFVKMGVLYEDEDGEWVIDDELFSTLTEDEITVIHRDNFDELVEVIKIQNYLEKPKSKETEQNPVDEETRKLLEDMERHRKRVEAKKQAQKKAEGNDDDDIDISDIISAVSSKSNSINKLNIWKFTIYQIYDEYARLEVIDNYDFSIKAMMAGAENIELKHWSSKL